MKYSSSAALLIALAIASPVRSAEPAPAARSLVEDGVSAYVKGTAKDAIKFWLKGSALEGNPQALTQANSLTQIEDFYGRPVGFDLVKEYEAGPRTRILYFTINYEKGVAFANFQVYRNPAGQWIATQFSFNTDAMKVFPSCLFPQ